MGNKDKKVRVAIIGVGICASALIQGVHYYNASKEHNLPIIGDDVKS